MQITVKTAGLLGRHLPPGSSGNEARLDIEADTTPLDVMRRLALPERDSYLVMLNGDIVPSSARPKTRLKEGDELGIFPPLKGG